MVSFYVQMVALDLINKSNTFHCMVLAVLLMYLSSPKFSFTLL